MSRVRPRWRSVRALIMDVDGVLTDGGLYYTEHGDELKRFDVRDGQGLVLLRQAGILTAIVTGKRTTLVARRADELGIAEVHQGVTDKAATVTALLARHGVPLPPPATSATTSTTSPPSPSSASQSQCPTPSRSSAAPPTTSPAPTAAAAPSAKSATSSSPPEERQPPNRPRAIEGDGPELVGESEIREASRAVSGACPRRGPREPVPVT